MAMLASFRADRRLSCRVCIGKIVQRMRIGRFCLDYGVVVIDRRLHLPGNQLLVGKKHPGCGIGRMLVYPIAQTLATRIPSRLLACSGTLRFGIEFPRERIAICRSNRCYVSVTSKR